MNNLSYLPRYFTISFLSFVSKLYLNTMDLYAFCKLYFVNCAITVVLIISPLHPLPSAPHSLRQFPYQHSVMHVSSLAAPLPILYFTSLWLFCNYLFVLLIPLLLYPFPYTPLVWQPSKLAPYPCFCLCSSCVLSLLLDSIVDRYVFFAILLFIVLIFFVLKKSL